VAAQLAASQEGLSSVSKLKINNNFSEVFSLVDIKCLQVSFFHPERLAPSRQQN
jgi:hypothetical protein